MIQEIQLQKRMLLFTCGVAALGGFLFGFDMAVVSGVLPFVQKQFDLTAAQEGWFVSAALVGCISGVAISGSLGDRLGRKKLLIASALLFLFSALGCSFLNAYSMVIFARILGGIGVGIASNIVPLYISEIAPAKIRGRLVTYYQLALTFGILVAYCTNALLLKYAVSAAGQIETGVFNLLFVKEVWRGMFSIGILPAALFFTGLIFVPESPRWLIQKGRKEGGAYRDLFASKMRRALILGILLPLFSQFCGINAIIYYGLTILNGTGISLSNSFQSQVIFGLANMLFTLIAVWKVDKLGRRPLYIIGTTGATLSLFLTGLCFYLGMTANIWLLLLVLVFLASFAFSIGPLKFVVASEIFPTAIRGRAMALSIMVMWVADTIVVSLTPVLLREIGTANTFWLFSLFCLVALVVVYFLLPETKGKSLEQIEDSWKTLKKI